MIDFRILGPLEAIDGPRVIDLGRPQQRALLVRLLLAAPEVVSVDRLVEDLWEEGAPSAAVGTLQTHVSRLRRAMGPYRADLLARRSTGYALEIEPAWIDANRFEQMVLAARAILTAGEAAPAAADLRTALALWRGPALADVGYATFAQSEIHRLDELRSAAADDLTDARLALGEHAVLLGELDAAIRANPLRERLWGQQMLALYRCGRQADALRAFSQLRETLADELGIDPSPALRELEQRILEQDPVLAEPEVERAAPVRSTAGALPSGTLTLLVATIEGGPRLLHEIGSALYSDVVTAYHRLARGSSEPRDGVELLITSETVSFVFTSASGAIGAALDLARALDREPWPGSEPVRVAIGVHTGELVPTGDARYVGPAVHQAEQVAALAWGGQILASSATRDLCADPPDQASWRALGSHRMPDFPRPVEVFQLCHASLAREFPALRSVDREAHNLPIELTTFVGRADDLARAGDLLGAARLVTLIGPGGAGKTRFAVRLAADRATEYRDGVWMIDLAPLTDPNDVTRAFADVVGVREQPGVPLADALVDWARSRDVLLLADNCEHVIVASAFLIERLLRSCKAVTVLATSRERLDIPGETAFEIPPLSLDDSIRLFHDRAANADLVSSAADEAAVESICRRLDGLPLAIELAAASARSMPVVELEQALDDRFSVLTKGYRTALPRQQTLRGVIDWSHDRLDDEQRVVFRRAAVFAGGFGLDAADVVCAVDGVPQDVLRLLDELVDRSLLVREPVTGPVRFRMLETIREYAHDALAAAGEADTVRARHASWCVAAAKADVGDLDGLAREHDNMRVALEWSVGQQHAPVDGLELAVALVDFWAIRGHWRESQRWLDAALPIAPDAPPGLRFIALEALGLRMLEEGDPVAAAGRFDDALVVMRGEGDDRQIARAVGNRGIVDWSTGDYASARRRFEESLSILRRLDDTLSVAKVLSNLGSIAQAEGEIARAAALFDEALATARELGDNRLTMWTVTQLGSARHALGDDDAADAHYDEGMDLAKALDDKQSIANLSYRQAEVALQRGELALAGELLRPALAIGHEIGAPRDLVESIEAVGRLCVARAEWERAARLLAVADDLRDQIKFTRPPSEQPAFDAALSALSGALGAGHFEGARSEAAGVSIDEAVALALDAVGV